MAETLSAHGSARRPALTIEVVATAALAVFVFSIPYENGVTLPGVGSLSRLVGMAALALVLLTLFAQGRMRLRVPSLFLTLVAVYVTWGLVSYFWSIAPNATLSRGATLVQLAAMVWMVHQLGATERSRGIMAQAFVLGAYASIGVALVAFFTSPQPGWRDVGGLNPNWFAIGCSFAVPVAWGLALRARRSWWFWVNLLYPAFAVFAVILSASRGGFITLLVALTVIPLTLPRLGMVRRLLVFAFVTTGAWATFVFAPQAMPDLQRNLERLQGTVDEIEEGTLTGRTVIWQYGVEAWLDTPLIGHGYYTFGNAIMPLMGRSRPAHNAFLSVAVGVGLIGLGLFVSLILVPLAGALFAPERRLELLVVIGTLVVGMMPANLEHNKSVWFLLSWVAAARPILIIPDPAPGHSSGNGGARVME